MESENLVTCGLNTLGRIFTSMRVCMGSTLLPSASSICVVNYHRRTLRKWVKGLPISSLLPMSVYGVEIRTREPKINCCRNIVAHSLTSCSFILGWWLRNMKFAGEWHLVFMEPLGTRNENNERWWPLSIPESFRVIMIVDFTLS